jgi:hypothetical protein
MRDVGENCRIVADGGTELQAEKHLPRYWWCAAKGQWNDCTIAGSLLTEAKDSGRLWRKETSDAGIINISKRRAGLDTSTSGMDPEGMTV